MKKILNGQLVDMTPEEIAELQSLYTLYDARDAAIERITAYDSSSAVNEFSYMGHPMWLDYDLRSRLRARLAADKTLGKATTKVWYSGVPFDLDIAKAEQMLMAVESYSAACYDVTQTHLAAVQQLQTIGELDSYDYKSGYPDKLAFGNE